MNRIPVLLHKRPPLRPFAPCGGWRSREPPPPLPPLYPGQPQECELLSGSCKVLTRRSASVYTHVALLSQLHLAVSPSSVSGALFLPYLPLSWQMLFFFSVLFFSQQERQRLTPVGLSVWDRGSSQDQTCYLEDVGLKSSVVYSLRFLYCNVTLILCPVCSFHSYVQSGLRRNLTVI